MEKTLEEIQAMYDEAYERRNQMDALSQGWYFYDGMCTAYARFLYDQ